MLLGCADGDAHRRRARRSRAAGRTITPFAEQLLEERAGVLADLGEEEVGHRRADRVEAVRAQDPLELCPTLDVLGAPAAPSSCAASRLASAASCAGVVTSNARRTLPIAVTIGAGATP